MNYEIIPLRSQGEIEIYGVRFNNRTKNFMYWKNRRSNTINEVVAIFNKDLENIRVQDGDIILSLKNLDNNDLAMAVNIFRRIMGNNDIKIRFVVLDENERVKASELGSNLGINYEVNVINKKINDVEKSLKEGNNKDLSASGSKNMMINDDSGIKKVTINDNKAYVNNGALSIDEKKYLLLQEWKKDPVIYERISNMSKEELDRELTRVITSNLKEYRMESSREQVSNDKRGEVAVNKAYQEDGLVNAELGIVKNNLSSSNQYSAVEKINDNVRIVNPNVMTMQINSGGVIADGGNNEYVEGDLKVEEEQSRDFSDKVFYLDSDGYIYNEQGEEIGRVGNGYMVDYETNSLMQNGQVIGTIGDYKDMGKDNNKSNTYVKTLKKELDSDDNKGSGFISFPVIIFILSALLLIGSLVLLFVLE